MKKVFHISPELSGKKIIILGTGQSSLLLFSVMLQNDVYVDAFFDIINYTKTDFKIINK